MDYVVKVNGLTKQANGKRMIADINLHIKKRRDIRAVRPKRGR